MPPALWRYSTGGPSPATWYVTGPDERSAVRVSRKGSPAGPEVLDHDCLSGPAAGTGLNYFSRNTARNFFDSRASLFIRQSKGTSMTFFPWM